MTNILNNKRIVLGVSGSIACYKSVDIASKLMQSGSLVDVLLTKSSTEFITPLTFRSITHRPVITDFFDIESNDPLQHISIGNNADLIVVAPATANIIAKLAMGLSDDPLTTTILASKAPVIIAPAMDGHMYEQPVTTENIAKLSKRGFIIVGPLKGHLASGITGYGRLADTSSIIGHIRATLGKNGDLAGKKIVVSAGGTQEPIDLVRVITNRSSGKMGYAIAEESRDRGSNTILITASNQLSDPVGIDVIHVESAIEMDKAVQESCRKADVLIMAAAVADYRPASYLKEKLKKSAEKLTLSLVLNPDILKNIDKKVFRVGFAAESQNLIRNAQEKLKGKDLDLIVANDITSEGSGFGSDTNQVVIIGKNAEPIKLPLLSKQEVASKVLDQVFANIKKRK